VEVAMRLSRILRSLVGVVFLAASAPVLGDEPVVEKKPAAKKPAPSKFIRIKRDAKGEPLALETATVRYVPASGDSGVVVDLIGAVHVGDRSYFEALNHQFEQYDVLLYELVAPPGTRIPKGGKQSDNPIAMIQRIVKTVLELESQTELVDYTKKNFVHADMSPEQMAEAIRNRGDNGFTLFLSVAADILRQQNLQEQKQQQKGPGKVEADLDVFSLLLDPNAAVKLKRLMAEQFEALASPAGALGHTLNTILITDRNQAALKVFQKELAKGKKKIGIFYGAAHLPDFEKRLRDDFGLKRDSDRWLTAWDMRVKKNGIEELFKLLGQ
jgi:hypothetical protein